VSFVNPVHLLFVGVVALLVLGPKRLPEAARSLGNALHEFRQALDGHAHQPPPAVQEAPPVPPVPPVTAPEGD
jgi:sec-independent protein translocase protein TatA